MEDRHRLADERQRGAHALAAVVARLDREVAGLTARRRPQRRQVTREPLLQLAGPAGSEQGRARRASADVDQETSAIGLGRRRRRAPRQRARDPGRADRGDEDGRSASRLVTAPASRWRCW